MNRQWINRLVAYLLAVSLLFSVFPVTTKAAASKPVWITVCQEEFQQVLVYESDSDLLFSGEDLADFSGFSYKIDGNNAIFTHGEKIIRVDLEKGKLYPLEKIAAVSSRICYSVPMKIDGVWYFSGASLLPWLNVTCDAYNGNLIIQKDELSIWELYAQFDPEPYLITLTEIGTEFGYSSKVFKAMHYMDDNLKHEILEFVSYEDEYGGSEEDYFILFEKLLLDKAHTEYMAETYHGYAKISMDVSGLFLPDKDSLKLLSFALDEINNGILYASYYAAFEKDHQEKLSLVENIIENQKSNDYTDELVGGARRAKLAYSDVWTNIFQHSLYNMDEKVLGILQDTVVDNKMIQALLLAVDMATEETRNLNECIDRMGAVYNLAKTGLEVYENTKGCQTADIEERRSHAILYLFACEENLRTLAQYAEKKEQKDLAGKYSSLAEEANEWMGKFLLTADAQLNDSINYYDNEGQRADDGNKDLATDAMLKYFGKITRYTPPEGELAVVEYAIIIEALKELALTRCEWTLLDQDNDGHEELVVDAGAEVTVLNRNQQVAFQYLADADDCSSTSTVLEAASGITMDNPNLSDWKISGDTGALLKKLDNYFADRMGLYAAEQYDIDGDGEDNRKPSLESGGFS